MDAGIRIEIETLGDGREATRGDTVTVEYDLLLSQGDVNQVIPCSCSFVLGKCDTFSALEYGVEGMRVGGRRRFQAEPGLCSRGTGVEDRIPPDAVIVFDLKLLAVSRDPD